MRVDLPLLAFAVLGACSQSTGCSQTIGLDGYSFEETQDGGSGGTSIGGNGGASAGAGGTGGSTAGAGGQQSCVPGGQCAESTDGAPIAGFNPTERCQWGSRQCNPDGSPGACIGAIGPAPEVCNNVDDDCDEETDEGLPPGDACSVGVGACERTGVMLCKSGEWICGATTGTPGDWNDVAASNGSWDWNCDGKTETRFDLEPSYHANCSSSSWNACTDYVASCESDHYILCDGTTGTCGETLMQNTCVFQGSCKPVSSNSSSYVKQQCR